MNVGQYAESQYINPELLKASKTREAVIISDAKEEDGKFGKNLVFEVDFDQKVKKYQPNKDRVYVASAK